jgi:hypothetical protein
MSARQEERREFDSGLGIHRRLPTVLAKSIRKDKRRAAIGATDPEASV